MKSPASFVLFTCLFALLPIALAQAPQADYLKTFLPTPQDLAKSGLRGEEPKNVDSAQAILDAKPSEGIIQDLGALNELEVYAQILILRFSSPTEATQFLEGWIRGIRDAGTQTELKAAVYGDKGYVAKGRSDETGVFFQKGAMIVFVGSSDKRFTAATADYLARLIENKIDPSSTAPPPPPAPNYGFKTIVAVLIPITVGAIILWKRRTWGDGKK